MVYADNRIFYCHSLNGFRGSSKLREDAASRVAEAFRLFGTMLEDSLGYNARIVRVVEAEKVESRGFIRIPEAVEELLSDTLGCQWHLRHYLTNSWYRQSGKLEWRRFSDEDTRSAYRFWELRQKQPGLYSFISRDFVGCGVVLNGAPAS